MLLDTKVTVETITGWSLHCSTQAQVCRVARSDDHWPEWVQGNVIPRGSGQSFGDASLPDSGVSLTISQVFEISRFSLDRKNGVLKCPAGMTQRQVLERIVPLGWVLPTVPGSSSISIGGAVAADAHGKNHYASGSIADHVLSLEIMLASDEVLCASRTNFPDIFWATIGGLGLTGVILEISLQLQPLSSTRVFQEVTVFRDVHEMLDIIEEKKSTNEFLLGTVDGNFDHKRRWCGVVTVSTICPSTECADLGPYPTRGVLSVPEFFQYTRFGSLVTWALNQAICFSTRHRRKGDTDLNRFFFPQDGLANWNRLFGQAGFVDYQCCIPIESSRSFLVELHKFLNRHAMKCFLVAIKRFRQPCNQNPLVFAQEGISIAMDMPLRQGTREQLNALDALVISFGGRVNLVKDARLGRSNFNRMYPRKNEWLATKHRYDPGGRFRSKLSTRLGLNSR